MNQLLAHIQESNFPNNQQVFTWGAARKGLTLLTILFVFPLGLIIMWVKRPFSLWIQLGITATIMLFVRQLLVLYMIFYGAFVFPEASAALRHYCFGDGSTLIVQSDYIKSSPVVWKRLKNMKVGEKGEVRMRQRDDVRLSYALNPFQMERKKDKVIISQWMQFDTSGKVHTNFGPIPLPDNIVHVFDCTPFLFYSEFTYDGSTPLKVSSTDWTTRLFRLMNG